MFGLSGFEFDTHLIPDKSVKTLHDSCKNKIKIKICNEIISIYLLETYNHWNAKHP